MSNKKINYHRYDLNKFRSIIPLMVTNPIEAKKQYEMYIKKYPQDYSAYPYYASSLITLGYFKEAEEILDIAEYKLRKHSNHQATNNKFKNFIITKIRLLAYQEKFEELYQLSTKHYQKLLNAEFSSLVFYARKKTSRLSIEERNSNTYLYRQIINYQESDFLEHIKKHLSIYNQNIEEPNPNLFTPNIDILKITEEIKKYLLSDKRIYPNFIDDIYIFRYDNCGTVNQKPVNYFKVICLHNTKNLITMCPVKDNLNIPYIDLNYLNQENIQEITNPKIKRLSQIEKFNQRYNHN